MVLILIVQDTYTERRHKVNRFTHLDIFDFIMDEDGKGSFNAVADDQLIDWIEGLRKAYGYTDFIRYDNDVYYNFFVIFDTIKREVKLCGTANGTEQDDYAVYECKLNPEEKEHIIWLIIHELSKLA